MTDKAQATRGISQVRPKSKPVRRISIALAGNANVGKSVIFNQLTGAHQTIGNWPGKTVEKASGTLRLGEYEITIVDLPGVYSLSAFSIEEIVSREYIAREKPDVIINVIGAPVLERNLFFTTQLLELDVPVVICLNQIDIAQSKGLRLDGAKLSRMVGVPVVPTVAAKGQGVPELIKVAIRVAEKGQQRRVLPLGDSVEEAAAELGGMVSSELPDLAYPARWTAIKLLEGDAQIAEMVSARSVGVASAASSLARRLEATSRQSSFALITSERYALAGRIAHEVQYDEPVRPSFADRLDRFATHKVFGYVTAFSVVAILLLWTFTIGNLLSGLLSDALGFFHTVDPQVSGTLAGILWNGVFGGLVAGITLVIPYVVPFYLMLAALEDSGILTRVAFMMDSAMHQMGLHGKAVIPIILGYGCNVPAIYATRIMSTRRERLLAALAITFAPCTARTIIIIGMVAAFLGVWWALGIYTMLLLVMFVSVRLSAKVVPGELTGLIMEMHSFKTPSFSVMVKQTWTRTKSLIFTVMPIYIVASAAVQGAYALGILTPVGDILSPLTVGWLGLPVIAGTLLIFGLARKELILLMAVVLLGSDLTAVLAPVQLAVLAFVGAVYPCLTTVGVLVREFGWKASLVIVGTNLAVALLLGGLLSRVLTFVL